MKKLFGTDGVRGKANTYPMIPEVALALGQAIAHFFQYENTTHRIVIGKDTRCSSYMIELAIASGICSMGSDAILLGPMSTPGVSFITRAMRADAGIMISASHNPFADNGIKFFDRDGFKLSDEIEVSIEAMVENKMAGIVRPVGVEIGKAYRVDDALGRYVEFVKNTFPKSLTLDRLKVIVDCANGAAYKLAPMALWELEAEVEAIAVKPNGTNINADCGALHPEHLCRLVRDKKADVGIALDGDADRVILCDENGRLIDGDQVLALCAVEMKQGGSLNHDTVVGTIMTNMGVENFLKEQGIGLVRTPVGDRYIIDEMVKKNIKLGGEPSGHIIFSNFTTTGDGLIAALQVLATMVRSGKKLSELIKDIPLYPQINEKLSVKEKKPLEGIPAIGKAMNELEGRLHHKGRAVIRYSGTEPVLRLMIEGEDRDLIRKEMDRLIKVAQEYLG